MEAKHTHTHTHTHTQIAGIEEDAEKMSGSFSKC